MTAETYSYVNMILLSVLGGVFVTLAALLGYWASDVNKSLKDIRQCSHKHEKDLIRIDDRSQRLDEWARMHDTKDDDRHSDIKSSIGAVQQDILRSMGIRRGGGGGGHHA